MGPEKHVHMIPDVNSTYSRVGLSEHHIQVIVKVIRLHREGLEWVGLVQSEI